VKPGITDHARDFFTDPRDGSTDYAKIAILGSTAAGGYLLGGKGIMGKIIGVVLGTAGGAIAAGPLMELIRGPIKPNRPPIVPETLYQPANPRVVSVQQFRLPAIQPLGITETVLDVPRYNASENPPTISGKPIAEINAALADLRERAARAHPYATAATSPEAAVANHELRELIDKADRDVKRMEVNLRFTGDRMRERLPPAKQAVDAYLTRLGIPATDIANLSLDLKLDDVPGMAQSLSPELEEYGKKIMLYKIRNGLGVGEPSEADKKAAEAMWAALEPGNKRAEISNFVRTAINNSQNVETSYQEFFPEMFPRIQGLAQQYTPTDPRRIRSRYDSSHLFNRTSAAATLAAQDGNWLPVSELLKERLREIEAKEAADRKPFVTQEVKNKLKTIILGLEGEMYASALQDYTNNTWLPQLRILDRFNTDLRTYEQRTNTLSLRMQALERTKMLLVSETPIANKQQTFSLVDARDDKKQRITVTAMYKDDAGTQLDKLVVTKADGSTREITAADLGQATLPRTEVEKIMLLDRAIRSTEAGRAVATLIPGLELDNFRVLDGTASSEDVNTRLPRSVPPSLLPTRAT
ncbi:MAG: hypothetical protein K2Q01_11820, partial [Rickettsiales bacterium]|nr:hypothetical protein [Rickettsiales bacterium]